MPHISSPKTTVAFYELAGSPLESYTSEGFSATRRFLVRWEERNDFARDVMGHTSIFNYQCATYYPDRTSVFPTEITFAPADEKTIKTQEISALHLGLNSYDGWALAEIHYKTLTDSDFDLGVDTEAGTSLTYRLSWESIEQPLPTGAGWKWADTETSLPDTLPIAQHVPMALHTLVWSRVLNPPWRSIQETQGKINASTFLECPPGTLLFEGATANKLYRSTFQEGESAFCWAITYTFRQKAIHHDGATCGWNHFFRASDGKWITVENNGKNLYDATDFASLFETTM